MESKKSNSLNSPNLPRAAMKDKKFNYTAEIGYICPCCKFVIGKEWPDYCPNCEVRMTYPDCPEVDLPQDWANYIGYLNGLTKNGRIRARSFKEMYGYELTQPHNSDSDWSLCNRILQRCRKWEYSEEGITEHAKEIADGIYEIHLMGEAYSKEFLGDAYKKDGLREMAIELGYVEGFLVAKRLPS